jgi:hypothetical protein
MLKIPPNPPARIPGLDAAATTSAAPPAATPTTSTPAVDAFGVDRHADGHPTAPLAHSGVAAGGGGVLGFRLANHSAARDDVRTALLALGIDRVKDLAQTMGINTRVLWGGNVANAAFSFANVVATDPRLMEQLASLVPSLSAYGDTPEPVTNDANVRSSTWRQDAHPALIARGIDGVKELADTMGITTRVLWGGNVANVTFSFLNVVATDPHLIDKLAASLLSAQ